MSQGHDRPTRPPIDAEIIDGVIDAVARAIARSKTTRSREHILLKVQAWANDMQAWFVWAVGHREFLLGEYVHHNQKDHGRSVVSPQSGPDGDTDCKVCAYLQGKLSGLGLEAL